MKILFDNQLGDDVERHARYLHREMLKQKNLPRIACATRALIQNWCDECGERAWGPVAGGLCRCSDCWAKRDGKNTPGF